MLRQSIRSTKQNNRKQNCCTHCILYRRHFACTWKSIRRAINSKQTCSAFLFCVTRKFTAQSKTSAFKGLIYFCLHFVWPFCIYRDKNLNILIAAEIQYFCMSFKYILNIVCTTAMLLNIIFFIVYIFWKFLMCEIFLLGGERYLLCLYLI